MILRSRKLANEQHIRKRRYNRKMVKPSNSNAKQVIPPIGGSTTFATTTNAIRVSQGTTTIPSSTASTTSLKR